MHGNTVSNSSWLCNMKFNDTVECEPSFWRWEMTVFFESHAKKQQMCASVWQLLSLWCKTSVSRITLNGGPAGRAGWRAVLPNEKHELSAGWRAAQSGPAGCTTGLASGLHIKLRCGKGRFQGMPFSAARPDLFRSPPHRFFVQPALLSSSVQPADSSHFSFGKMALHPARPSN